MELSGGLHSNGFIQGQAIIQSAKTIDRAAEDLVCKAESMGLMVGDVDRVIGPAMGAINISGDIARHISFRSELFDCLSGYTEKAYDGARKYMVLRQVCIRRAERIVLCDDVLSTGLNVRLAAEAILRAYGIVLPFVFVLANRSGLQEIDGRRIVSLIDYPMKTWEAGKCPLCAAGSKVFSPDSAEILAKLNWED